jgi:hypothetical protein
MDRNEHVDWLEGKAGADTARSHDTAAEPDGGSPSRLEHLDLEEDGADPDPKQTAGSDLGLPGPEERASGGEANGR